MNTAVDSSDSAPAPNADAQGGAAPRKAGRRDWIPVNYDLRDTWFPVSHSRDVTQRPIRRIIHSQPYYLWRDDGKPVASEFRPDAPQSARARTSAFTGGSGFYPVVERYGYVWAWYGNPDHVDVLLLPHIPFLPLDGSLPGYTQRTVRFDATSALSVENLLDLTHADFLHAGTIGDGISESDVVEVEWNSETLTRTRIVTQKSVAPIMRWVGGVRAKYQDFRAVLHVHLRSNVCISYPRFRPGYDVPNLQPFLPVGRHRSRCDVTFNTTAAPVPLRYVMPRIAFVIQPQDNSVVRPQNERYFDPDERPDLHSRFDTPGTRYRFQMESLAQRQQRGDFSYGSDADPGRDISGLLGMNG
ncbi:oxygenase [Paraburkholderia dinghuensis]|uniref:Oxygenase n=1 Tax=Paraburkholderia dinghuensis TaxID=2305225 RepID=A0A3N6MSY3_9BURK|nr:oxygenase [Paraburkholderia dinghuensis]RQH04945.1 oxygenase [Paraburkholderia dinghuensis]